MSEYFIVEYTDLNLIITYRNYYWYIKSEDVRVALILEKGEITLESFISTLDEHNIVFFIGNLVDKKQKATIIDSYVGDENSDDIIYVKKIFKNEH